MLLTDCVCCSVAVVTKYARTIALLTGADRAQMIRVSEPVEFGGTMGGAPSA